MTTGGDEDHVPAEKVGFRDIYRAVGESEARVKEHISLVLLPLSASLADHEKRLRAIEDMGSDEARDAMAAATKIENRLTVVEKYLGDSAAAGVERRRLGDLSGRAIAAVVLVSNFVLGLVIMLANLLTDHSK